VHELRQIIRRFRAELLAWFQDAGLQAKRLDW
jgi:hypothetical protein